MKLTERVAVITGAAQGIGAACARLFAAEGAKVVIGDVNETSALRSSTRSSVQVAPRSFNMPTFLLQAIAPR